MPIQLEHMPAGPIDHSSTDSVSEHKLHDMAEMERDYSPVERGSYVGDLNAGTIGLSYGLDCILRKIKTSLINARENILGAYEVLIKPHLIEFKDSEEDQNKSPSKQ